ncbi:MAG: ribonuclease P protein component [Anaerolineales bacterium]|nr:ribonuclease P protein component [Anaerolineales bacterium]
MNRKYRLTSATDFKRVRRNGKSYAHPLVIVIVNPNGLSISRFGVAAGRSVGGAVQRNRAKRLLREGIRRNLDTISGGWDVILIARAALVAAGGAAIQEALAELLARAGLLK